MNKHILNSLFALLLVAGGANLAHAISIPDGEDAVGGPGVWNIPVYNNSGGSLAVGDVVVWDNDSSTGDDDNYVTTTTTADTYIVAGVVWPSAIASASSGTIAVHGVVAVNMAGGGQTVKGMVCTSAVAKKAQSCATNAASFGHVTTATASGVANVFLHDKQ